MKGVDLVLLMEQARVRYIDRDILRSCTPDRWNELYSGDQLDGALRRIRECIHHACVIADCLDDEPAKRLEKVVGSIRRALSAAYTGSAEDGSFFRGTSREYTPCVFSLVSELDEAIAALRK